MSTQIGKKSWKEPEHKPAPAEAPKTAEEKPKKVTKRGRKKAEK